ncbi:MAG: hypothetical protein V8Q30_05420 [Acutalibacteraceae bacterium]
MNSTEKNWDREWARQLRAEHRWQRQALNRTPTPPAGAGEPGARSGAQ